MRSFTAVIEWDSEGGHYVGWVPGLHGAHTVGDTLDELRRNLIEVVEFCLEELGEEEVNFPEFIGTQKVTVEV